MELKKLSWMKEVVEKFSRRGDLVMDYLAGTSATSKSCMLLLQNRRFVLFDVDPLLLDRSFQDTIRTFAKFVLHE